jgi:surfactin synthase thioesterase subunit
MDPLVAQLARELERDLVTPFAFIGHSMGAFVAFELARRRELAGQSGPVHLFACAASAPHLAPDRPALHLLDDDALLREIEGLGGMNAEYAANAELRRLMLPTLRADLELCETYSSPCEGRIACAVTVVTGRSDAWVRLSRALAWRELTTGDFQCRVLSGAHFFATDARQSVARIVGERLGIAAREC